jgi:hypothetical protein
MTSFLGWTAIYCAVWSLGFAGGFTAHTRSVAGLASIFWGPLILPFLPLLGFLNLSVMAGGLFALAAWALPLYYDWHRIRPILLLALLPTAASVGYFLADLFSAI